MVRKRDEPVRLTRIYTRGGDGGETSLGDGSRVSKLDPLVRAYGEVDELNSLLGWAQVEVERRAARADPERALRSRRGSLGAVSRSRSAPSDRGRPRSTGSRPTATRRMRRSGSCVASCSRVAPRRRRGFTWRGRPAGGPSARCRRRPASVRSNPLASVYLNRLSDLLFVLARAANAGGAEPLWRPGGERPT